MCNSVDVSQLRLNHITLISPNFFFGQPLKDKSKYDFPKSFPEAKPTSSPESQPSYTAPKIGFFDLIFGRKARILADAEAKFHSVMRAWEEREHQRSGNYAKAVAAWEKRQKAFWDDHLAKKATFEEEQAASHGEVERLKSEVSQGNEEAVIEHASLVLEASDYHDMFEKSYLIQYHRDKRLLKVALACCRFGGHQDKLIQATPASRSKSMGLRYPKVECRRVGL